MSEEKPLHVRVAEAIGFDTSADLHQWDEGPEGYCVCTRCDAAVHWSPEPVAPAVCVPRYDTDWSATGPLIEKYGIWLQNYKEAGFFDWRAEVGDIYTRKDGSPITGQTPLEAVCNLILELAEAGKL